MAPVEAPSSLDKSSSEQTTDVKPEEQSSFDDKPGDDQQISEEESEDPTATEAYKKETIIDIGEIIYLHIYILLT